MLLLGQAATPARAGISVVGGLSRESVVRPGARTEGRIVLRNTGSETQQVRVFQTDYRFTCDGRNDYGEPGSTPRSNARWLALTPSQLTVPAGATESAYYTLHVPDDPTLTGTYWSIVMVEPIPGQALEPPRPDEGKAKLGLQSVVRYGIQIVTHIADTGTRALRFVDRQLVATQAGQRILQMDAESTGERWLVPLLWAELYDAQGALVGRFEGGKYRIYPGCSVRYRVDLTGVPPGHYKALVVADNGDDHVFGAQYELDLE
ncbi:MAG: hypothetical protein HYU66_07155 [Armatimonadetes bacterium]|nr:hypothetical protein [Armatimonadota bacterium]